MKSSRVFTPGHLFILALAPAWLSCIFQSKPSSREDAPPAGMVRIPSAGKQVLMGSTDSWAKQDEEAPRLTATFAYDFFMDKTEVTQALYESLMGRNPATTVFGLGAGHPVYNVTWYDAVLFCNERSKRAALDTVYVYSSRKQDANGRTYALEGLAIRYEVRGYRLPTEAEWEYAARAGAASAFPWGDALDSAQAGTWAWYGPNAGGQVRSVGLKNANAWGLHDMTGNVMEWVNDWKAPYAELTVQDFLGSRDPGILPERSVKGGAFSYDLRYLRFSGRSANYPTLSSAAAEYVGFRCVLGPLIGAGRYLSGGQAHGATPPVSANADGALQLFGHNQVKIVFVNTTSSTRTLCYADFTESPLTVHEFLDDSTVFTPVISPDGQWVAYADVEEGSTRAGSVKIRRLQAGSTARVLSLNGAGIPRWWVDPVSADTFLVVASNVRDNLDPAWPSDQTYKVRVSGGVAAGPWQLLASGSYHDGLSNDGKYLATGYRRLKTRNLITGGQRTLFTGPANGKPAGDTSQVCNVSIHPNFAASSRILLLDFGYSGSSSVVGRPYGLHEILFRIDTSGSVASWYGAPQGFVAWQDVEWSNHPDFAAGLGEDQSRGYPAVVGLSLSRSETAVLARGTALREPGLWVKPGVFSSTAGDPGARDSLGRYDEPAGNASQTAGAAKRLVFWYHYDSVEVALLGSSHVNRGLWPPAFEHFFTLNLGYGGGEFRNSMEMLQRYVVPHSKRLRAVVFELHPGTLAVADTYVTWQPDFNNTLGGAYDRNHGYWVDSVPSFMDSMTAAHVSLNESNDRGWPDTLPTEGWGYSAPAVNHLGEIFPSTVSANLGRLKQLTRQVTSQGIHFMILVFPQSPVFRKTTPHFGRFGPDSSTGKAMVAEMKDFCATVPKCMFYDAHLNGFHDYDSLAFLNEDHLSRAGATRLGRRLDSLLFKVLGPRPAP